MKYEIVCRKDPKDLVDTVNSMLRCGWKLQGGLAMSQSDFFSEDYKHYQKDNLDRLYAQALILESEPPKPSFRRDEGFEKWWNSNISIPSNEADLAYEAWCAAKQHLNNG